MAKNSLLARLMVSAFVVFAVVAVAMRTHRHPSPVAEKRLPPSAAQVLKTEQPSGSPTAPGASSDAAATADFLPPLPTNATSVPDEYLLKLSAMVDLANARYQRPDKARWERAIPMAQKLSSGPCDCEQRNWLNHFVAMGNAALTDADDDYYVAANLMATLGRNDKDAMAISHRPD